MKAKNAVFLLLAIVLSLGLLTAGCDLSDDDDEEYFKSKVPSIGDLTDEAITAAGGDIKSTGLVGDASVTGSLTTLDNEGRFALITPSILSCPADLVDLADDLSKVCLSSGDVTVSCDAGPPVTLTLNVNDCEWVPDSGYNGTITITELTNNLLIAVDVDITGYKDILKTYYYYMTNPPNEGIKIEDISALANTIFLYVGYNAGGNKCKAEVTVDTGCLTWTSDGGCGLTNGTYGTPP